MISRPLPPAFSRANPFRFPQAQSTEGYWDPTSSVAFALCARARQETDALDCNSLKGRFRECIGKLSEAFEEADGEGNADITDTFEHFMSLRANSVQRNDELDAHLAVAKHDLPNDDPLECQAAAIVASIPPQLVAAAMNDSRINVVRVWTTLCCMVFLQELPFCWIWGDGACSAAHVWSQPALCRCGAPVASPSSRLT